MTAHAVISTITATPRLEERKIVHSLVLAFAADPVNRWVYPDPDSYLRFFPEMVRVFAGKAFEQGTAYYAEGFVGGALWLPPGVQLDEQAFSDLILKSVSEEKRGIVFEAMERMGSFHPAEPHWYLPLIGVEPMHQRKGYGSILLRAGLAEVDRQNMPAYLEASSPLNMPLYKRHGFEQIGVIQVGDAPPLVPMLRRPQGPG